jgi:hypothetical protein
MMLMLYLTSKTSVTYKLRIFCFSTYWNQEELKKRSDIYVELHIMFDMLCVGIAVHSKINIIIDNKNRVFVLN